MPTDTLDRFKTDQSATEQVATNQFETETEIFARKDRPIPPPNPIGHLYIALSEIQPSNENPRDLFDADQLEELTESIRTSGVLQPILVWEAPQNGARGLSADGGGKRWTIIAGERRFRAAMQAGLIAIPAILSMATTEDEAYVESVKENFHRVDLDLIARAKIYLTLMDRGWSQEKISRELHAGKVSVEVISNTSRLIKLPQSIHEYFRTCKLTLSHSNLLLKALNRAGQTLPIAWDKEAPVIELAQECVENNWTTKTLDQEVERRFKKPVTTSLPLDEALPAGDQEKFVGPGPLVAKNPGERELSDDEWEASAKPSPDTGEIEKSATEQDGNAQGEANAVLLDQDAGAAKPQGISADEAEREASPTEAQTASEPPAGQEPEDVQDQSLPADSLATEHAQAAPAADSSTALAAPSPASSAAPTKIADAPKPQAKSEAAPTAPTKTEVAPSLPAGWTTALIKVEEFQQAQAEGLWPLTAALEAHAENQAEITRHQAELTRLRGELEAFHAGATLPETPPSEPSMPMVLAGGAASRLAEVNATSRSVFSAAETQLLDELFPQRQTTDPDHIVAVLLTMRLRDVQQTETPALRSEIERIPESDGMAESELIQELEVVSVED